MKNSLKEPVLTEQNSNCQGKEHSSLSPEALKELIFDAPDRNIALIAKLKKTIEEGQYDLSASTIAKHLLQED